MSNYYVYRFKNKEGRVIYVGKTSLPLATRFNQHGHLPDKCYEQVERIEYTECNSAAETTVKEVFYINLYRDNKPYYNRLDLSEPIQGIEINDRWHVYVGPLPPAFNNSWNRKQGFTSSGIGEEGKSKVDYLLPDDIELLTEEYLKNLESANTPTLKRVALRDIAVFLLGINSPLRPKELASIQYGDLFDEYDAVRDLEYALKRNEKDKVLRIQLPNHVKRVLEIFREFAGLNYRTNWQDPINRARQHNTPLTVNGLNRRISEAAAAAGLNKSVGSTTMRKTYLMNIFNSIEDKVEAILLLDRLNGGTRLATVANYLGFEQAKQGFDVICEARYPCGEIDIDRIQRALNITEKQDEMHFDAGCQSYGDSLLNIRSSSMRMNGNEDQTSNRQSDKPVTNQMTEAILEYIEKNPDFLYSELSEHFCIPISQLLNIVSSADIERT